MPEQTSQILGDILRKNIADEQQRRHDQVAKAEQQRLAEQEEHRRCVTRVLRDLRTRITRIIQNGSIPPRMRLPGLLDDPSSHTRPITYHHHRDHEQWQAEMDGWARQEGMVLAIHRAGDGYGTDSWWELAVSPLPGPANT